MRKEEKETSWEKILFLLRVLSPHHFKICSHTNRRDSIALMDYIAFLPPTTKLNRTTLWKKERIKICLILCTLNHPFFLLMYACVNDVNFSLSLLHVNVDGWISIFFSVNFPHKLSKHRKWSSFGECEWHKKCCWYCILPLWLGRTKNGEIWQKRNRSGFSSL